MDERNPYLRMSAAGNRFVVFDGWSAPFSGDPSEAARTFGSELGVDGLLLALPPEEGAASEISPDQAHVRMEVWNRDGSRAEACGNGLRCVTKRVHERLHRHAEELRIATDAGLRRARPILHEGCVVAALTTMGEVRIRSPREALVWRGDTLELTLVELGNPHAVLFVDDLESAPVEEFGAELQGSPLFPAGTNVEFVQLDSQRLFHVRIFERGVGETASCGTGAAAAAVAAMHHGHVLSPVVARTRGGDLRVVWDPSEELWLEGPVIYDDEPAPFLTTGTPAG